MDILELIKKRCAIRKYKNKKIPRRLISKIIEAGIWGPSIHGVQPWKFVIINNQNMIKKILRIITRKPKEIHIPSFILHPTMKALLGAKVIICVYNTKKFSDFAGNLGKIHKENAVIAELSSISAAIQNMMLTAEGFGIGSCWLGAPLFFKRNIKTHPRAKI